MPSFNSRQLLQNLQQDVSNLLHTLNSRIVAQPHASLLRPPAEGSWNVVQCLDHLNSYSRFYIPGLVRAIEEAEQRGLAATPNFKSGWLGNYFTNLMAPQPNGKPKSAMKAPKGHRPTLQPDVDVVLAAFAADQRSLLQLLSRAEHINIARVRVATSLTPLIKMSAGDTFRFLIAHEQRHMLQALRALLTVTGNNHTALSVQSLAEA